LRSQVPALGASPVLARQHLGGPVRPPVGTDQSRRARHNIADNTRRAPAVRLGDDDVERLGRRRLPRRLRPARTAASLGSVLGRPHQTRHASPAAADQLPTLLHVVRPSVRHRMPRHSGLRLSQPATHRVGKTTRQKAVASLGLVSPGAATDGVTCFPEKKTLTTFLVIAVYKVMTFFAVISSQLPPSDGVLSSVLSKSSSQFFHSGVTPWMVSPGAPPPVTPLAKSTSRLIEFIIYWRSQFRMR